MIKTFCFKIAALRIHTQSSWVANLHVELAVVVLDRGQNVAAVQIFRPEFLNSDCVEVCV